MKIPKNSVDKKSLLLGLLTTMCLIALFFALWLSGIGRQEKVPETAQKTLQGKSKAQKQAKVSKASHPSSEVPRSTTQNTTTSVSKVDETPAYIAPSSAQKEVESIQSNEPVVYQATVGQFSKTSTLSQADAQNQAQEAYNQAQEQANRQEAERIKSSIEQDDPNAEVNIIQQGD